MVPPVVKSRTCGRPAANVFDVNAKSSVAKSVSNAARGMSNMRLRDRNSRLLLIRRILTRTPHDCRPSLLDSHPDAGRDPVAEIELHALRHHWIPAFAGMT